MEKKKTYTADEYRWAELACQRMFNSTLEQSLPELARLVDPNEALEKLARIGKAMDKAGIKIDSPR